MRLAMTTWNERVSPVFDVARQALVLDIEGGEVVRQQKEALPGTDPFRQASRVAELAPDVLVCGAVSRPMAWALSALAHSCRVFPFVSGSVEEVLRAWQEGRLPSPALSMPGCRARRGRRGGGSDVAVGWVGVRTTAREREGTMQIIITSSGPDVSSAVDPRFGRARYFLVYDTETGKVQAHDNTQNLNAAQGAGIQAGQTVSSLGVEAVVSGNFGPKAFRVLSAAGIRAYRTDAGTVAEAIQKFKAGILAEASSANVEGHW